MRLTKECFHFPGIAHRLRHELTKWLVEQHGTDHGQTHFNNIDRYAIDPTGLGTEHAQNDTVQCNVISAVTRYRGPHGPVSVPVRASASPQRDLATAHQVPGHGGDRWRDRFRMFMDRAGAWATTGMERQLRLACPFGSHLNFALMGEAIETPALFQFVRKRAERRCFYSETSSRIDTLNSKIGTNGPSLLPRGHFTFQIMKGRQQFFFRLKLLIETS